MLKYTGTALLSFLAAALLENDEIASRVLGQTFGLTDRC
jgi:hypothetical protein